MDPRARYDEIADDLAARDPDVELSQMMGMPCIKSGGKMVIGYESSGEMVFKLPDPAEHEKAMALDGAKLFDPSGRGSPSRSGSRCRPLTSARGRAWQTRPSDSALAEPAFFVPEDDRVLATLQNHVEIAPLHRILGPPAIDDAPLLTDESYRPAVDLPRRPVEVGLDQDGPWGV